MASDIVHRVTERSNIVSPPDLGTFISCFLKEERSAIMGLTLTALLIDWNSAQIKVLSEFVDIKPYIQEARHFVLIHWNGKMDEFFSNRQPLGALYAADKKKQVIRLLDELGAEPFNFSIATPDDQA